MLWLKAHNHRLLRACLLGSKRKLPPPVCQARLGLLSVVCRLRGVLFPCTVHRWSVPHVHTSGAFSLSLGFGLFCALFLVILFSNPGCRSNFLILTPFLGPHIAYTYYLGVPHDHILYLLTLGFWFQNFVNGKQLSAVSWTKKFNHLG